MELETICDHVVAVRRDTIIELTYMVKNLLRTYKGLVMMTIVPLVGWCRFLGENGSCFFFRRRNEM